MSTKLPQQTWRRIKGELPISVKLNENDLKPKIAEYLSRYTGEHVPPEGAGWQVVLNEIYPIIQWNLPAIFFRNPKAYLKPRSKFTTIRRRDPISEKFVEEQVESSKAAATQEAILNYALYEMRYKKEVQRVLFDALVMPFGVLWHGYQGKYGITDEGSMYIKDGRVFVRRISPIDFVFDPCAYLSHLEFAGWVGRKIRIRLSDLREDTRFDVDKKIKGVKGFSNPIGDGSKKYLDYSKKDFIDSDDSNFIDVYELFVRPTQKQRAEGENGWIVVMCDEQDTPLRVDPWSIKAEGYPATPLYFNDINDCRYPFADIEVYRHIADQKNYIVNLQLRNAQENTNNIIAIASQDADEDSLEKVIRGENNIVKFNSENVNGKLSVAASGTAASQELYMIDGRIQNNLDEKSGVSDLRKGVLRSGEESATSVKIRASSGATRPSYRQDIMADMLRDSVHYINQLLKQYMPYKDAVRIVGTPDVAWSDKPDAASIQADTDTDIDVISMLPESPESEMQTLDVAMGILMKFATDPVLANKVNEEGKKIEFAPLIDKVLQRLKINVPGIFRDALPQDSDIKVSSNEMTQARENVMSVLQTGQPAMPAQKGQDHLAHLQVYTTVQSLLALAGQQNDMINSMIAEQQALLQQAAMAKQPISNPSVATMGE